MLGRAEPGCCGSLATGGLEVTTGVNSGVGATFKKRSRGWARRLSMLGDTGGRIPCRICLVFNNASECEVSFVFFFLKNMYIYLRVPGLFIDMCVDFITRSKGKQNLYPKHSLTALLISNFDMTGRLLPLHMHLNFSLSQVAHSSLSLLMQYNQDFQMHQDILLIPSLLQVACRQR